MLWQPRPKFRTWSQALEEVIVRDFGSIAQRSGVGGSSLERALNQLLAKQVIVRERAYSATASKVTGDRGTGPYLRFWLRYVGRNLAMLERGVAQRVVERVLADWTYWKGWR